MLRPGTRTLGLQPLSASPPPPPAAQHPSWDNVLFPGDRAGHQRSLHLFIFLNISYFERMINNKESEIRMGTFSVLFFFGERGCLDGMGWGVSPMARQRGKKRSPKRVLQLHGNGSASASTQGCHPGDNRVVGMRKPLKVSSNLNY